MLQFKLLISVIAVTSVIGLAISYLTKLLPGILPDLNFLEAVGVYCFWVPVHQILVSVFDRSNKIE